MSIISLKEINTRCILFSTDARQKYVGTKFGDQNFISSKVLMIDINLSLNEQFISVITKIHTHKLS